jgi:hypothetical protein
LLCGSSWRFTIWKSFLANHSGQIVALDVFVLPSTTFWLLYALLVLSHDRRRVLHCNVLDCGVTAHPTAAWTASRLLAASKPVIAAIAAIFSKPLSPISVSSMVRLTNAEKGFTDAGFKHLEEPTYRHRIESSGSLDGPPQLGPRQDAAR